MEDHIHWLHHKIFLTVLSLIIINLIMINVFLGLNFKTLSPSKIVTQDKKTVSQQSCSTDCTKTINEMGDLIKSYVENAASSQEATRVKEYFIPLGAGATNSGDWTDITGAEALIDSTKYGKIKKITFEVSARSPNNNQIIYLRLFNDASKGIVSNSEVNFPSATTQYYLSSSPIVLTHGPALYKVQMKTQLLYPATLDQARIHIVTY